jgi:hypothetical protein
LDAAQEDDINAAAAFAEERSHRERLALQRTLRELDSKTNRRERARLLSLGYVDEYFVICMVRIKTVVNRLPINFKQIRDLKSEFLLVDWATLTRCKPEWAIFTLNICFDTTI